MKVTSTTTGNKIAVVTRTIQGTGYLTGTIANDANGAYMAVSSPTTEVVFPGIKVDRTGSERHNSEIVVWNVDSTNAITISIELCPWNGGSNCYSNNSASIKANERRIFTAEQLQYAPNNGSLTEQGAWLSARVKKTGGSGTGFVAMASVFKQNESGGKIKAEQGSTRYFQMTQPVAGTSLYIPAFVKGTNTHRVLIANTDLYNSATVTAKLYNSAGTNVGTWSNKTISAKGNLFLTDDDADISGTANGVYSLIITANRNLTAQHWFDNGSSFWGDVSAQKGESGDGHALLAPYTLVSSVWKSTNHVAATSAESRYIYAEYDNSGYPYASGQVSGYAYHSWNERDDTALGDGNYGSRIDFNLVPGQPQVQPTGAGLVEIDTGTTTGDKKMAYNMAGYATTWYVPFAPAPVLQYAPNDSLFKSVTGWRSRWNGTNGNADFTGWEFYNWNNQSTQRSNCSNYTNAMVMHKHPLPHDDSDMGTSNIMPSACAGRPILLFNEPEFWTANVGRNASDYVRLVFYYRAWPGDVFCCGNFEHTGYQDQHNTDGEANQRPWFANITRDYTQAFGDTKLPIDGVHMHVYVTIDKVDVTNNVIVSTERTDMGNKLAAWDSYIDSLYGATFPVVVSEWSIAGGNGDVVAYRNQVRSGMVDLARLIKEKLGDHVTEMIWFWAWGSDEPFWGARRLIAYGATVNTVTDNLSYVGQCYMDIVTEYNDGDGIDWPTTGVCFQDE